MAQRPKRLPREITVKLPERHEAQRRIIEQRDRYNVLVCARRFGKTELAKDLMIDGIDENDPAALLRGGSLGYFVPEGKLGDAAWDQLLESLGNLVHKKDSQSGRLTTLGGGNLEFWTMKSRTAGRGRKYHRVIIDEAGFEPDLKTMWEYSIRPTLTDYRGDAWMMSSPNGPGFFKQCFQRGQRTHKDYMPGWMSWQMPTAANPFIDPAEIEEARLTLSDRAFQQEYLAKFVDKVDGWFRSDWRREYKSAVPADQMVRVMLVDPASGKHKVEGEDFSVWWILGLHSDGNYYILDFVRERYDLSERVETTIGLHRLYQPHITGYESYGMQADIQAIQDQMEREQYRFDITELGGKIDKPSRIERLVPPMRAGRFWFPGPQLRGSLIQSAHRALKDWWEDEVLPYPAGPKAHDDGLDGLSRVFDCGALFPSRALPKPDNLAVVNRGWRPPVVQTTF
jgi:predicted phage terminase large subunit-like protein